MDQSKDRSHITWFHTLGNSVRFSYEYVLHTGFEAAFLFFSGDIST